MKHNDTPHTSDPSRRRGREQPIAVAVTLAAALAIFIFLYFGKIGFDRTRLTEEIASETEYPDEEELFLDPELLDPGEEESRQLTAPAAPAQGMPEVVPEPKQQRPVVKAEPVKDKPTPPKEKLVSTKKPSPVKAVDPRSDDKELRKAQSKTAGAFSPDNGQTAGRNNANGSAGTSTGISGHSDGWRFLGCPSPDVRLRNRTVITVSVTVNSRGEVTSATARGGNASLRAACEQAARRARWKPLDPANTRTARGTITFTITPR